MENSSIQPHPFSNNALDGESKFVKSRGINFVISLYDSEIEEFLNNSYLSYDARSKKPKMIKAEYMLLDPTALPPYRKRPEDLAYDIFASDDGFIPAWGSTIIPTGIAISVKRGNYYTIEGRSGLGTNDNLVPFRGQIDSTYTGELKVKMYNLSNNCYNFKKHERIAQIAYHEQIDAVHTQVENFSPEYCKRGSAGFGSSGK